MTFETSKESTVLSAGHLQDQPQEIKFPEILTLGEEGNSFHIQIVDLPPDQQMTVVAPNIIQINSNTSETQRSLLLFRFIVNMTYRVGKVSGAIQNELNDAEIDGMSVGIWQWLGTSGMLGMVTPAMMTEWLAKTRMEIEIAKAHQ